MKKDIVLDQFESEWKCAVIEKDCKLQAQLLRGMLQYLKNNYGTISSFSQFLEPKVKSLEDAIPYMTPRELIACASATSHARKQLKESTKRFGGGFTRKPSKSDLREIRLLAAAPSFDRGSLVEEDDSDPDVGS
jgi:hypothetical protein